VVTSLLLDRAVNLAMLLDTAGSPSAVDNRPGRRGRGGCGAALGALLLASRRHVRYAVRARESAAAPDAGRQAGFGARAGHARPARSRVRRAVWRRCCWRLFALQRQD
jgi:hypothetical protein